MHSMLLKLACLELHVAQARSTIKRERERNNRWRLLCSSYDRASVGSHHHLRSEDTERFPRATVLLYFVICFRGEYNVYLIQLMEEMEREREVREKERHWLSLSYWLKRVTMRTDLKSNNNSAYCIQHCGLVGCHKKKVAKLWKKIK